MDLDTDSEGRGRTPAAFQAAGAGDGETRPVPVPPPRRARVICWALLSAGLLALASPWLAQLWIGFDLFTQLLPHLLALALGGFACLLWGERIGLPLALLIFIAVVAGMAYWSLSHVSPDFDQSAESGTIRVMSFNLWRENEMVDAVEGEIRRNMPDLVAMPEFVENMHELPARLKDILPHRADCLHKPFCYLGLLSRWPIVRVKSASLWVGPPYLHAWVKTPRGIVHVYVTHTLRVPWIRSHYKQVRAMARIVNIIRGEPAIVMGDFNAAPYSYILKLFPQDTGLKRHTWLPSWPARPLKLPQIAIDHVFTSSHFVRKRGPWVGKYAGSDHLPVILELQWWRAENRK